MNQTIKHKKHKNITPLFKYKKKSLKPISTRKQKLKKLEKYMLKQRNYQ